jgi:hypothetical protein
MDEMSSRHLLEAAERLINDANRNLPAKPSKTRQMSPLTRPPPEDPYESLKGPENSPSDSEMEKISDKYLRKASQELRDRRKQEKAGKGRGLVTLKSPLVTGRSPTSEEEKRMDRVNERRFNNSIESLKKRNASSVNAPKTKETLGYKDIGGVIAPIVGVITLLSCYVYCIVGYGFLLGGALGWIPAAIVAGIVSLITVFLWLPLVLVAALGAFYLSSVTGGGYAPLVAIGLILFFAAVMRLRGTGS